VLQELFPSDWEVRTWCCKWFQEFVNSGFIDPKLVFFLDERKFLFDGKVKRQSNRDGVPKISV
jgi:hypothetical protein